MGVWAHHCGLLVTSGLYQMNPSSTLLSDVTVQ